MQTETVDQLNRQLGQLGLLADQPRFAWRWAPDLVSYSRKNAGDSWTEHNWADQLGKVWVLTMLRPPVGMLGGTEIPITEQSWWQTFRGTRPYPGKLTPYVFAETALIPGLEPSEEKTSFYIATLGEQMNKSLAQLHREGEESGQRARDANHAEFMEMADDSFPAFWSTKGGAHTPGTRGGHIAFQR